MENLLLEKLKSNPSRTCHLPLDSNDAPGQMKQQSARNNNKRPTFWSIDFGLPAPTKHSWDKKQPTKTLPTPFANSRGSLVVASAVSQLERLASSCTAGDALSYTTGHEFGILDLHGSCRKAGKEARLSGGA